ncbi:pentapeptide repeat-containing protein [Cryobacterium sp. 1639]|uniref:pentapeptide repeat-containing protein n=1 Tax=Cryobacterium inferilacus TaxID=2866629 RepID=UPI0035A81B83
MTTVAHPEAVAGGAMVAVAVLDELVDLEEPAGAALPKAEPDGDAGVAVGAEPADAAVGDAELVGAEFEGAEFEGAEFEGAELVGADLVGAPEVGGGADGAEASASGPAADELPCCAGAARPEAGRSVVEADGNGAAEGAAAAKVSESARAMNFTRRPRTLTMAPRRNSLTPWPGACWALKPCMSCSLGKESTSTSSPRRSSTRAV